MNITKIWYEFDAWSDGYDENDGNADVHFALEDGSEWCAAFYTYQNLRSLSEKNRATGELLAGRYFYADKPIFIEKLDKELIAAVLQDLLENEPDLSAVFTRTDA